jgi:hypothetical protein
MNPLSAPEIVADLKSFLAAALALCSLHAFANAETCESRSAVARVAVLELYTSEGCSSCPPADSWVSALPAKGLTSERVVPLVFHVDYWDQLGWPDRMAKAQFSLRQRMQADRNHARVVYTPQLLLNGKDYQAFAYASLEERLRDLGRQPAGASVLMRQRSGASSVEVELDVRLEQLPAGSFPRTYVAITENHLQTAIKAGENQGRLLNHDFVVREFNGPLPTDSSGRTRWKSAMALPAEWKRADLSLVAFVQDERSGEILQALQAPLCAPR